MPKLACEIVPAILKGTTAAADRGERANTPRRLLSSKNGDTLPEPPGIQASEERLTLAYIDETKRMKGGALKWAGEGLVKNSCLTNAVPIAIALPS